MGANKVYHGEFVICTSHIIQPSKEKLKTLVMQNLVGKQGVLWEKCKWRICPGVYVMVLIASKETRGSGRLCENY